VATVFELLETEWERLAHSRETAGLLPEVCALASNATRLSEVERYVRAADAPAADDVLLALVRRAVEDHALAARVLLQLLLPGTRRLARRWWAVGDDEERAAAAVAAVYQRIRSYPLARRPGRVAANILMDAAAELRRMVATMVTVPSADPAHDAARGHGARQALDTAPEPNPAEELADILREAVGDGLIGHDDAELIARSRIAGHRIADIARHRGRRPRTLWDRRQRAEHTLVAALHG
jgi:hypothetical protein